MESKLKAKEFPKLPEPPFVYLSDDEKIIKNMRDELEKLNQQTPITPESLEGIGFVRRLNTMFLNVSELINIHYYVVESEFVLKINCDIRQPIHFTSTEQITEWVKPFQSGVAEEVR